MTPAEIRNHTFDSLRDSLADRRRDVFRAFATLGAGTTEQLAARSGIGLLTLRPRVTELCAVGLLRCLDYVVEHGKRAGVYEAVTDPAQWAAWREEQFPADAQLQFGKL